MSSLNHSTLESNKRFKINFDAKNFDGSKVTYTTESIDCRDDAIILALLSAIGYTVTDDVKDQAYCRLLS